MVIEATIEARMLAKAETDRVEVRKRPDGRFTTWSAKTAPGVFYLTTAETCDCRGFQTHGHCKHQARVKAICPLCQDAGTVPYRWSISAASQGTGRIPCPRCQKAKANPWKHYS